MRHLDQTDVELGRAGPHGDREFCVVDRDRGQVLRTVDNPSLFSLRSAWTSGQLRIEFPDVVTEGRPIAGSGIEVDYWGRAVPVDLIDGPWASALSRYLDGPVALAQIRHRGAVVYGASVTLVFTEAIRGVWAQLDSPAPFDPVLESRRFRATFTIDNSGHGPGSPAPERWMAGQRLALGSAALQIVGDIPRCAVVNLDPDSGERSLPVLARLPRNADGEPTFGLQAVVERPGRVAIGDQLMR